MAGLMDMYAAFNAPQVSTGDYANAQQRKNELQNRRFSGLGNILSQNSLGALQQEYRAGTGRFAGLDPDRKFQVYYDALKAIDPATAETEQARYNTERQRRVGSEVASAYTSGGREPAVARLMQDNPELGIKLATDPASGALKEEDRLATQWRALMNTKNKKDFETLDRATKERINSQISGLESALSRTEYGKSLIGGGGVTPADSGAAVEEKTEQFYTPEISAEIKNQVEQFDNPNTETIEGIEDVKLWLAELREKAGVGEGDPRYKTMLAYIDDVAKTRASTVKENRAEEERKIGLQGKQIGVSEAARSAKEGKMKAVYTQIDLAFPGLREKDIPAARKAVVFLQEGDRGNMTAKNNAVKALSRLGSDEALSESDFGRALGRGATASLLGGLASKMTGANPINITDAEWANVKSAIMSSVAAVKDRRALAIKQAAGGDNTALEQVPGVSMSAQGGAKPISGATGSSQVGAGQGQTANGSKWRVK